MNFLADAQKLHSELVALRRELHRRPELSGEEYETTKRLHRKLENLGIEILSLPLETGVVGILKTDESAPTVVLRADIDALPLQEKTGAEYASENEGVMHACGHDFHSAALIGAAKILKQNEQKLEGNILFLFQPAEETVGGAELVLEAGAFEVYPPQAVFGLHNRPDLPAGSIGVREGPLMAAADTFALRIHGKGGHAATPHETCDPIVAGSALVGALQTIVSRTVDPLESAVVSVGSFQAGTTHNIIPDTAQLKGTVRTFREEVRDSVEQKLHQAAEQVAAGYGTEVEVDYQRNVPAVVNDEQLTAVVRSAAEEILGKEAVVTAPRTTASEDFSLYQREVPGCFFWAGVGNKEKGIDKGWHHPEFDVDEAALPSAAAVLAKTADTTLRRLQERAGQKG